MRSNCADATPVCQLSGGVLYECAASVATGYEMVQLPNNGGVQIVYRAQVISSSLFNSFPGSGSL